MKKMNSWHRPRPPKLQRRMNHQQTPAKPTCEKMKNPDLFSHKSILISTPLIVVVRWRIVKVRERIIAGCIGGTVPIDFGVIDVAIHVADDLFGVVEGGSTLCLILRGGVILFPRQVNHTL